MGKPVDDGLNDAQCVDSADSDLTFHHSPPLYGSIIVVFFGVTVAILLAAISQSLSYPPVNEGRLISECPEFDKAIPAHATIEVLATGFAHLVGLAWLPDSELAHDENRSAWPTWWLWHRVRRPFIGAVLFSDAARNTIYKWQDGTVTVFARPAGYTGDLSRQYLQHTVTGPLFGPAGLAVHPQLGLLVCQHGDRRVALMTDAMSFKQLAKRETEGGTPLNSPHRVVVKPNGDFYFTDPPLGLVHGVDSVHYVGQAGVYLTSGLSSTTHLVSKALSAPTGLVLSRDGRRLYVADGHRIVGFDVRSDGTLATPDEPTLLYEHRDDFDQHFGGLAVDAEDRVYAAGLGGIYVVRSDGKLLGRIGLGINTTATDVAWDDEYSELFVTTTTHLLRVALRPQRDLT